MEKDDLLKNEKIILHTLNVHERCGTPVEFFSSPQWFIKLIDFKKDFLERGKQLKWYPLFMLKRYEDWVSGLNGIGVFHVAVTMAFLSRSCTARIVEKSFWQKKNNCLLIHEKVNQRIDFVPI